MAYLSYAEDFQGVADAFLRDADRYGPLLRFIEDVMTRDSELTKAEREMLAMRVSRLNHCEFCVGAHRWTLAAMDIDLGLIGRLENGDDDAPLTPKMRALLRFADKLTESPGDMAQGDVNALLKAGWSEQAVEDATNVIALFAYVNRLVDGMGITGEEPYLQFVGRTLATQGYRPLIQNALKKAS